MVSAAGLLAACAQPPQELQAQGGEQIYAKLCSTCHAPDGRSLATLAPPLAGHAVRMLQAAGRGHLIRIVLNGMSGPIEVGGRSYNGIMAPLRYLKDDQISDVLNHILTSWGNETLLPGDFQRFTPDEVRAERVQVFSTKEMAGQRPKL
jgi:mono/diheme cytochrome c family protein